MRARRERWLAFCNPAAHSGDPVVFDVSEAPDRLPRYASSDAVSEGATRMSGRSPAATAVTFASFDDPEHPLFG